MIKLQNQCFFLFLPLEAKLKEEKLSKYKYLYK